MNRLLTALCVLLPTSTIAVPGHLHAEPLAIEGPIPADRGRNLTAEPAPNAIHLGGRVSALYFDRDAYVGAALTAGAEHRYLSFHVTAPVQARVWDFTPWGPPAGPAACAYIGCQLIVEPESGRFTPLRLLGMIDHFRIRTPYDIVTLELGPLTLQQGAGTLVDRMANRLAHTDVQAALRVSGGFPDDRVRATFSLADMNAPLSFMSAHVSVRPGAFFVGGPSPWWLRVLGRAQLSMEVAGDALTDVPSQSYGGTIWPERFGGLYGGATRADWPLFSPTQFIQVEPGVSASVLYGLRATTTHAPGVGAGARGGGRVRLNLPYVALSVDVRAGASTAAHRNSVFGPLYVLERRGAIGSASQAPTQSVTAGETPAGFNGRLRVDAQLWHWLRTGLSLHIDNAPGRNHANAFVELGAAGTHVYASVWRRGFSGRILGESADVAEAFVLDDAWLGVLAADAAIWGPFSIYGRAVLAPRLRKGGYRHDVDVTVGLSTDLALSATGWLPL